MNSGDCWYECTYPGLHEKYFVNIHTGLASRSVPDHDDTVHRLREPSMEGDDCGSFCFYISFELRETIFLYLNCCYVKKTYIKQSPKEIDLIEGEFVFVKTRPVKGWVYIETTSNLCGYVPFSYLEPILVDTENSTLNSVHVAFRTRPQQYSTLRHSLNITKMQEVGSIHRRRRECNHSYNFSFQNSQADNTSIQLLNSMLPMYIRKIFSNPPVTPYDIWLIEVARKTLSISQSAFLKLLQDCSVDVRLYNELITYMGIVGNTQDFIEFEMGDSRLISLQTSGVKLENRSIRQPTQLHDVQEIPPVEKPKESVEKESELEKEPPAEEKEEILQPCEIPSYNLDPLTPIYPDIALYDFKLYASIYFQREKPRFFHPFSLDELASYSGRIPLLPLHRIPLNTQLYDNILEVERKILMFMNIISYDDDESNETVEEREGRVMQEIAYQSVVSQDFFDEILCYLIKQTNNNPDEDSQIQGYRIMYLLLSLRRPSFHLFKYVLNYVYNLLNQSGLIGSLSIAIIQLLLNDNYQPEEQCYNSEKYMEAKKTILSMNPRSLSLKLFEDSSLEDVIRMENAAFLLLKHGILPPTNTCYAWDCEIPACSLNECNLRQFLNPMLQGIVVYIKGSQSRDFKERVIFLDPSLLKITWVSTNPNKIKHHQLCLRDINDVMRVGTVYENVGPEHCTLFGIQFFGITKETTLDIAVRCEHERDRILQFFNSWIKWYKLKYEVEIKTIIERTHFSEETEEEEKQNRNVFYRDIKRSLENYFSKTQMMSSGTRYYSTVNGYDFMALGLAAKLPGSAQSSMGNSLSDKKPHGSLKGSVDLTSTSHSESGKKSPLAKSSSQNSSAKNTLTFNTPHMETVIMRDLIEYTHHPHIPRVLQILCRQLVNMEGYKEEGIFRISAGVDEYTRLRCALSTGHYAEILSVTSVHTLASVIKDFVRCLSPKLVSSSLWDEIIRLGRLGNRADLEEAWNLLKKLPEVNYMTLMFLLTMMYKFSFVESNKMSVSAFMIVLGPNIIEREMKEGEDEMTANMVYASSCRFVNDFFTLITDSLPNHFDTSIFQNDFPMD